MPQVKTSSQTVARLVARALSEGSIHDWIGEALPYAGDCLQPVNIELRGKAIVDHPGKASYRWNRNVDVLVRCRMCTNCLRHRARLWTARAVQEIVDSPRTWFGTLTLAPDQHYRTLAIARRAAAQSAVDFDALSPDEQFKRRHKVIVRELQKWLKRVRKNSRAKLRYLLVAESHKSGLPHYHVLVHEVAGAAPVTYRHLSDAWTLGHSKFNLVAQDSKAPAYYVSKYLAKSALAKVQASARYGVAKAHLVSRKGAQEAA